MQMNSEAAKVMVAEQHKVMAKADIMRALRDLDGLALEYELETRISEYGKDQFHEALDELIQCRWIYVVRTRK